MIRLEIEIFHNSDEAQQLYNLGVTSASTNHPPILKRMTFFHINGIGRAKVEGDPNEYGSILTNGMEFITKYSYQELQKIVNDATY